MLKKTIMQILRNFQAQKHNNSSVTNKNPTTKRTKIRKDLSTPEPFVNVQLFVNLSFVRSYQIFKRMVSDRLLFGVIIHVVVEQGSSMCGITMVSLNYGGPSKSGTQSYHLAKCGQRLKAVRQWKTKLYNTFLKKQMSIYKIMLSVWWTMLIQMIQLSGMLLTCWGQTKWLIFCRQRFKSQFVDTKSDNLMQISL